MLVYLALTLSVVNIVVLGFLVYWLTCNMKYVKLLKEISRWNLTENIARRNDRKEHRTLE